ncbi:ABC-type molybdate transport system permease-like protein [Catenovulum agarivorans DS-2]|uniref:Molybdenum transport system permease n=1 Tax=Catenovulum agarivorans DS-2 TaxID=1328313 RepID=W7QTL3_9ALTE|nr:molybdate ABC transporter permease subunit [Catenovulum agarivorans]EWH12367.1 ABC-type molybdate transport system permease-like protein [Catenovulum agarivorans DS-2]
MFGLTPDEITALWLTFKLAGTVTIVLLFISTPLAWWLARSRSSMVAFVSALVALPIVLPPSVLGFYFLIAFSPQGVIGQLSQSLGMSGLAFSFSGLVIASVIYSLPFVVQPIQNAFVAMEQSSLEAAATLGANPLACFFQIALPNAKVGLLTGAILGFAHTVGEFGVILMIGGNIPGETQVVSVKIYEYVESLNYTQAHRLSAILLVFSFIVLFWVYLKQKQAGLSGRV